MQPLRQESNASTTGLIGMKKGLYSRHSLGSRKSIEHSKELFLSLLRSAAAESDRPFVMADYGAADGGTSIGLMTDAVNLARQLMPQRRVNVYYTDLPGADFEYMFRMLGGHEPGLASYVDDRWVFAFASGISFHRQIFPESHVDLGLSINAMHYISTQPPRIPDHIHSTGATGIVLAQLREIGRKDWFAILENRARELRPGGKMLLANCVVDEAGRHLGKTSPTDAGCFETMNDIWQNLRDEGTISAAEYLDTNFPQYHRTVADFREPFDEDDTVAKLGLRLDSLVTEVFSCMYQRDYREHRDARRFATEFVAQVRSWSERIFANALSSRGPEERQAILNELYARYTDRAAAAPEHYNMDYVHCKMVVSKH